MAVKKTRCTRAPLQKSMQCMKQVTLINEKNKKVVVIAQEIKFARLLSSNDKVTRNRVLKNLRKWLTVRSQSSFEADFMRLWKGLFYCMWMSDKPLIQEELAESLSKIVHCFKAKDVILLYTTCALKTLGTEWFGIDQYRLDKFCMLVRRIIRQTFQKCKEELWNIEWIKAISKMLENLLIDPKICDGFSMHITEVFLEELSKISGGDILENVVTELIKPFVSYFILMDDERQIRHIMRHIFRYLIFQSNIGMDYMEKFKAWKNAGFPTGCIDAMRKIELSDEEIDEDTTIGETKFLQNQVKCDTEKILDPRAGRVDVELAQIPFDAKEIVILLNQYKFHPLSTTKSQLSEGKMPLGIKEIKVPKIQKKNMDTKSAAIRLLKFEEELYSDKLQKKRKIKNDRQLMQDKSDKPIEEELENINDETNSNENVKRDENEIVTKKRKIKHKLDFTDNLDILNKSHTSDENDLSRTSINLKGQHKINTTTNSKKRVKIALQCNTAQHTSEYISQIRKSPAIPFDANKKPLAGVLKASPIPSPINPFYKRNII
ncbi:Ribosomal RNA processing protein 1 like protein [Eufriesea mexicana]|uniref:Ribosomal RNA processing protein 1 like protein n=1 Tax=Eufriesea mexicana TaxID=516756 RepID=A0A310SDX3_9HYME|nr:Ribosomal RNA processing protein 1 like protein [Eufriesea mexicana]